MQHAPEHTAKLQAALECTMREAMAQYDAQVQGWKAKQKKAAPLTPNDALSGPSQVMQFANPVSHSGELNSGPLTGCNPVQGESCNGMLS